VKTIDINRSRIAKRQFIQGRAENISRKRPPNSQLVKIKIATVLHQLKIRQGKKKKREKKVFI